MGILLYLFCGGKMEDNLAGIFNLFDADGNKIICLKELYEVMSVFIEIAEARRIMWIWQKPWQKCSRKQMLIRMKLWTSMSSRKECCHILSPPRSSERRLWTPARTNVIRNILCLLKGNIDD